MKSKIQKWINSSRGKIRTNIKNIGGRWID